jgi:hypothetical protein
MEGEEGFGAVMCGVCALVYNDGVYLSRFQLILCIYVKCAKNGPTNATE